MTLRTLSLFAGIGGFDLGLERTGGFRTVAFCEIEPFCQAVLAKHWPGVPCYDDVRSLTAERLAADGISVDVVCGGFPCQDISPAGRGGGIDGKRSGLWREYARLVREVRPDWVIIENSHTLRTRGADRVLGDLEATGYTCWPGVVGAAHAGAPHRRKRTWLLANRHSDNGRQGRPGRLDPSSAGECQSVRPLPLPADAHGARQLQPGGGVAEQRGWAGNRSALLHDPLRRRHEPPANRVCARRNCSVDAGWWSAEPGVARMVHGVPGRLDRTAALGNALIPALAFAHGRAILAVEAQRQQVAA